MADTNTSGLATMSSAAAALPLLHWLLDPARVWPPPDAVLLAMAVGLYGAWHVLVALLRWWAVKQGVPQEVVDEIHAARAAAQPAALPAKE